MLALQTLVFAPPHGYGIANAIAGRKQLAREPFENGRILWMPSLES
jgi:hypothetical protein